MKKYILLFAFFAALIGCETNETPIYEGEARYLYFPNDEGRDSAVISFTHYLTNELDVPFEIALIGKPSHDSLEYKLVVVDSLTTALPVDYELPNTLKFAPNQDKDTIYIHIKKARPELSERSFKVTLRITANENFSPGIYNKQDIKVIFSNLKSQPLWWKDDVELILLGEYSDAKYDHFVIATQVSDLSDMSFSEIRILALKFKEYLIKNNIMEKDKDGNEFPMVDGVPAY